jgi:hypothetical protein
MRRNDKQTCSWRNGGLKNKGFVVGVGAVVMCSVLIICLGVTLSGKKITFKSSFYMICRAVSDESLSVSTFTDTMQSYGGAGYLLEYDEKFYAVAACYYENADAKYVLESLNSQSVQFFMLTATTSAYPLSSRNARLNEQLYLGNLNNLYSLSSLFYECANGLDKKTYTKQQLNETLQEALKTVQALQKSNQNNCFTAHLQRLNEQLEDVIYGNNLTAHDMRYLQVFAVDILLNIQLY